MSKLFRSEEMNYYSLAMPRENAWDILNDLGEISCLQFIDQKPNVAIYARPFANFVHRCDEIKIKIEYIEEQMGIFGKPIERCKDLDYFLKNMRSFLGSRDKAEKNYFEELEQEVIEKCEYLNLQINNFETITTKKNELLEFKSVLLQVAHVRGSKFENEEILS